MKIDFNKKTHFTGRLLLTRLRYDPPERTRRLVPQNTEEFTAKMPEPIKQKMLLAIAALKEKIKTLNTNLMLVRGAPDLDINIHLFQRKPNTKGSFIFDCIPVERALEYIEELVHGQYLD